MTLPAYRHRALSRPSETRVILLEPALEPGAPLRCDIVHVDRLALHLSDAGPDRYTAVSYTWGEPDFAEDLVVDGRAVYKITHNVDVMLRRLRRRREVLNLWIDAVCLNQADDAEKSVQVQLMGDIYARALDVVVWLGDEAPAVTRPAFAALRSLALVDRANGVSAPTVARRAVDVCETIPLSALNTLLCSPWFGRRWVVQEAALAHVATVHVGEESLPWKWLVDGMEMLLMAVNVSHGPGTTNIDNGLTAQRDGDTGLDIFGDEARRALQTIAAVALPDRHILTLLKRVEHTECFSAHDRLYSLFGVASDIRKDPTAEPDDVIINGVDPIIYTQVDYTRQWKDVYTGFAVSCLQADVMSDLAKTHLPNVDPFDTTQAALYPLSKSLTEHLDRYGSLSQAVPSWPSWVPDWRAKTFQRSDPCWNYSVGPCHGFANCVSGAVETLREGACLCLHLRCPGKVTRVLDGYSSRWSWYDLDRWVMGDFGRWGIEGEADEDQHDGSALSRSGLDGFANWQYQQHVWGEFTAMLALAVKLLSPASKVQAVAEARRSQEGRALLLMGTPHTDDRPEEARSEEDRYHRVWVDYLLRQHSVLVILNHGLRFCLGPPETRVGDLVPRAGVGGLGFVLREAGTIPLSEVRCEGDWRLKEALSSLGSGSITTLRRIGTGLFTSDRPNMYVGLSRPIYYLVI